ncbi:MAG TPA: DMT family transporter [Anaeromyxobacteraceae bacterium]|nr:DMT family transporter [Anaeromyxobacteraceae bacterium]
MADLALLLLTLVWGTTFTLVKRVLDAGTSPGAFLSLRFGLATAVLGAIWLVRRPRATPGLLRDGGMLGLAMFAGFALQTFGLRFTTPARSGFITGLAVVIVPLIARFLQGRRVGGPAWTGVVLAVVGLGMLTRPFGGDASAAIRLGDLLTLGCAAAYAFQIIWTSEFSPRHSLVLLTLVQIAVTFLGSLALLAFEPLRVVPSAELAGTVAFTGLVMTVGAFFVMNWAQRHTTAVRAAIIYALEPPAAAVFSHVVTGEVLPAMGLAGGALILLGIVIAEVGGALQARRAEP